MAESWKPSKIVYNILMFIVATGVVIGLQYLFTPGFLFCFPGNTSAACTALFDAGGVTGSSGSVNVVRCTDALRNNGNIFNVNAIAVHAVMMFSVVWIILFIAHKSGFPLIQ